MVRLKDYIFWLWRSHSKKAKRFIDIVTYFRVTYIIIVQKTYMYYILYSILYLRNEKFDETFFFFKYERFMFTEIWKISKEQVTKKEIVVLLYQQKTWNYNWILTLEPKNRFLKSWSSYPLYFHFTLKRNTNTNVTNFSWQHKT